MSISDWHSLGEVPYRKFPVYETMGWADTIQIEDYIVCGSNFGGPLALLKSNRKTTQKSSVTGEVPGDMKSRLSLYTSSGNKIVDIDWDNKRVAGMGWSDREELVVVLEDGASPLIFYWAE
jgi:vacuolar protein sorting-associated protein 16